MTRQRSPHVPSRVAGLGTAALFVPRLGDLAMDNARDGRVGVVVAVPGEGSATTYHLRPPGGGAPWSALADGTTLSPLPMKATHATLSAGGDAVYDPRARQGSIPVKFHLDDGSTLDGALILTSAELERLHQQTSRLVDADERALGGTP
ncbi:hypothetical protein SJX93_17260 [Streptomyces cyaneofuscatus]|uniref:hypothetical protein n=1 Tax=Streptomyces cyaneofuscatus TaxID=66883 RepID=UPI002D791F52|nr:hypothetical protein [Streptomyces cyaneofuscatus]WRO11254.1 hypothetical protein SJX93_17260 [Streptomyces cyaneofuscatus]